jgi:hypothetical protein
MQTARKVIASARGFMVVPPGVVEGSEHALHRSRSEALLLVRQRIAHVAERVLSRR